MQRKSGTDGISVFKYYLQSFNPDIIINSRLQGHGDYKTPEQGIPITRPEGPWEFCTTINTSWGYVPTDHKYKSLNQIIRMFCDCISMGGNMLLDIGPREDGTIDPRQEDILLGLGAWIRTHEEAVFGTGEGIMTRYYLGGSIQAPQFLTDPAWFKTVYVLSGVWQSAGWGTIIYLAALSGVDPQLHEAAVVDGASRFKRILHINIPAIVPTITILLILNMGSILGVGFEKILLLQNPNIPSISCVSTWVLPDTGVPTTSSSC